LHPELHARVTRERMLDVERWAETAVDRAVEPQSEAITIRPLQPHDVPAVAALALLDERPVPPGPLLVAELDGTVEAAVSLAGGEPLANPFAASAALVTLLELRAEQLQRAA